MQAREAAAGVIAIVRRPIRGQRSRGQVCVGYINDSRHGSVWGRLRGDGPRRDSACEEDKYDQFMPTIAHSVLSVQKCADVFPLLRENFLIEMSRPWLPVGLAREAGSRNVRERFALT